MFLARKASLQFTADHHFSFVRSGGDATGAQHRLGRSTATPAGLRDCWSEGLSQDNLRWLSGRNPRAVKCRTLSISDFMTPHHSNW